jgi:lipopolysaccharide export system protein LptC
MLYKNTLISILIIMVVTLITGLTLSHQTKSVTSRSVHTAPDAFMEGATILIMNQQGTPHLKMTSSKITHFPEKDTTHFTAPQLILYRPSLSPWYLTAKYARTAQGMDQIFLWEDVNFYHAADTDDSETRIKTSTLTIYPQKQTAETADLITLTQPNITVKAIGMHANLATGTIRLLSQARGEYVPTT